MKRLVRARVMGIRRRNRMAGILRGRHAAMKATAGRPGRRKATMGARLDPV